MKDKGKFISILTIICFCTVVLIPIGLALMWFFTGWKNKPRIIITAVTTLVFVGTVTLLFLLEPSYNTSGLSLPFGSNSGYTEFNSSSQSSPKNSRKSNRRGKSNQKDEKEFDIEEELNLQRTPEKKSGGKSISRWIYSILFFLFMLFLIIWQNIKASKKNVGYENPYVDTSQYHLPLPDDAKIPMVHFLKIRLAQNERVLFATETVQKDNEGDFAVTNQRIVIQSRTENVELALKEAESVSAATNSVMLLTSGARKLYIFLPENQMKYALAVVRWAYKKYTVEN